MMNIIEICNKYGIEVPEDKQDSLTKDVLENYVAINEHDKKINQVKADRDKWKSQADTYGETIKSFNGVTPEDYADLQKKLNDAKEDYDKRIAERDFNDALNAALSKIKFSSESAKKSIISEIRSRNLSVENGEIIGLNDVLDNIKKEDEGAFVVEETNPSKGIKKPHFTKSFRSNSSGGLTHEDYMNMTVDERIKLKNENPNLYEELKKQ